MHLEEINFSIKRHQTDAQISASIFIYPLTDRQYLWTGIPSLTYVASWPPQCHLSLYPRMCNGFIFPLQIRILSSIPGNGHSYPFMKAQEYDQHRMYQPNQHGRMQQHHSMVPAQSPHHDQYAMPLQSTQNQFQHMQNSSSNNMSHPLSHNTNPSTPMNNLTQTHQEFMHGNMDGQQHNQDNSVSVNTPWRETPVRGNPLKGNTLLGETL